ncbi:hypothetical protein BDZ94DRAFT_1258239 [Collybia nuda]|uniref:Uncharacterized protein n=1 Tax=Collybia nuda TaxID=64659 RepID=A0A9P5Y9L9_9AGAR|nr:hypothetical protein BDZ94DRAFT_1258239 [Collybia nuda]
MTATKSGGIGNKIDSGSEEDREGEGEHLDDQELPATKVGTKPSRAGRRGRPSLTRAERAKVRILDQHGVPRSIIATMLDRSTQTIVNTLRGRTKSYNHDEDDDYDHVDAAFTKQFPQLSAPHVKTQAGNRSYSREVIKRSDSVSLDRALRPIPQTFPKRTGRLNRKLRTVSVNNQPTTSMRPENTQSISTLDRPSEPVDPASNDDSGSLNDASGPGAVTEFLSCLAHDIAWVQKDLEKQDLGSMDKLLAIADWPEEDLHMMFREALPDITVPQRFILVKGLKKRYGEIIVAHGTGAF